MAVLIEVKLNGRVIGRCGEQCYDGIQPRCTCCCGGVNHGKGLKKAISLTKSLYDDQIREAAGDLLGKAEITRRPVEPVLFDI